MFPFKGYIPPWQPAHQNSWSSGRFTVPAMQSPAQAALASGLAKMIASGLISAASESRSEEHTSELQSLMRISYAVFCLKKKKHIKFRVKTTKAIKDNSLILITYQAQTKHN